MYLSLLRAHFWLVHFESLENLALHEYSSFPIECSQWSLGPEHWLFRAHLSSNQKESLTIVAKAGSGVGCVRPTCTSFRFGRTHARPGSEIRIGKKEARVWHFPCPFGRRRVSAREFWWVQVSSCESWVSSSEFSCVHVRSNKLKWVQVRPQPDLVSPSGF